MPETIQFDTTAFTQHFTRKAQNLKRRKLNIKHKPAEAIRHAKYQKICDAYKNTMRRKGVGRAIKVKGETMPTAMAANDAASKSWRHIGYGRAKPLREGTKHFAVYDIT